MFHVLRTRKWIAFQILQIIVALFGVIDDVESTFLSRPQLPLRWIPSSLGDFSQHHVIGVKPSEFYPLIVVLLHFLLVPSHSQGYLISYFSQTIQVDPQFIIVFTFVIMSLPKARDPYLSWNNYFSAEG